MTQLLVVYNKDGSGVDQSYLDRFSRFSRSFPHDDFGTFQSNNVAIGLALRWNTPESKYESVPLGIKFGDRELVVSADVRLDNRDQLIASLLPKLKSRVVTDSELLLRAYERWGEESPHYLLGDFCYVIWDEGKSDLFFARDQIGIKPLYYAETDSAVIVSNSIHAIAGLDPALQVIDQTAVAIYLVEGRLWDRNRTFFEKIKKVPPAHSASASGCRLAFSEYWRIEDSPSIHFSNFDAYKQRLCELVEDAVSVRTRSDWPIASHLSGGLDSSVVVAEAVKAIGSSRINTFNWSEDGRCSGEPAYFEWAFSADVASALGVSHEYLPVTSADFAEILLSVDISDGDTGDFWNEHLLQREISTRGMRTILSGTGGDELISYNGHDVYSDMLLSGKLFALVSALTRDVRTAPRGKLKRAAQLSYHLLFKQFIERYSQNNSSASNSGYLDAAMPEVKESYYRLYQAEMAKRGKQCRRGKLREYYSGGLQNRLDSWAISGRRHGVEYRFPLLDKRIVEFAIGVPADLFFRYSTDRYLFRMAFAGQLPGHIIHGNTKQEPRRVRALVQSCIAGLGIIAETLPEPAHDAKLLEVVNEDRLHMAIAKLVASPSSSLDQLAKDLDLVEKSVHLKCFGRGLQYAKQK